LSIDRHFYKMDTDTPYACNTLHSYYAHVHM
jgi:hypothetical protein